MPYTGTSTSMENRASRQFPLVSRPGQRHEGGLYRPLWPEDSRQSVQSGVQSRVGLVALAWPRNGRLLLLGLRGFDDLGNGCRH
jgi:hypothetical protein